MTSLFASRTALTGLLALLASTLLLCAATLWNGQPFFYPDTPTYLRGAEMGAAKLAGGRIEPWLAPQNPQSGVEAPGVGGRIDARAAAKPNGLTSIDDKVVLAGRSVYYGALLYASHLAGDLWLTVLVHALCVVYVLHLLMVRLWKLQPWHLVATVAALVALTPVGAFTGLLMPDIFASLAILAVGTLTVYWGRLGKGDRLALGALLLFGLAAHSSHVAIVALMLALGLAARRFTMRWRHLSLAGLAVVAGCVAGALAGEWAFSQVVTKVIGAPPLRMPHPMGGLIDRGPGTDFLRTHCPASGYVACAYVANFPTPWDDFLFSTDPARGAFALADAAGKRRMADEQLRFVVDVVRHDPLGVLRGASGQVLRQLVDFRVDVTHQRASDIDKYVGRVPDRIHARMVASRAAQNDALNRWLTATTYICTAFAVALALVWGRRARKLLPSRVAPHFIDLAWIALAGLAANAFVSGTLAAAFDRFQARVVWLLPFFAFCALALAMQQRPRSVQTGSTGTNDGAAEPAPPLTATQG